MLVVLPLGEYMMAAKLDGQQPLKPPETIGLPKRSSTTELKVSFDSPRNETPQRTLPAEFNLTK